MEFALTRRSALRRGTTIATGGVLGLAGCVGNGGSGTGATAEGWPMVRGTAGNTGRTADTGPDPGDARQRSLSTAAPIGWAGGPPVVGPGGEPVYELSGTVDRSTAGSRAELRVLALDRDGEISWRTQLRSFGWGDDQRGGFTYPRLCRGDGHLVASWHEYRPTEDGYRYSLVIAAVSLEDRSLAWRQSIEDTRAVPTHPVPHDGVVYVGSEFALLAFDLADGTELWREESFAGSRHLRRHPAVGDGAVAGYDESGRLHLLDAATGERRWVTDESRERHVGRAVRAHPTIDDGTVYTTESTDDLGANTSRAAAVRARSIEDGSLVWEHAYESGDRNDLFTPGGPASVAVSTDHVYYGLGFEDVPSTDPHNYPPNAEKYRGPNVVALDRSDGAIDWQATVGERPRVQQPLIATDDALYVVQQSLPGESVDYTRCYAVDRSDGTVNGGRIELADDNPISVAGGAVYQHADGDVEYWE